MRDFLNILFRPLNKLRCIDRITQKRNIDFMKIGKLWWWRKSAFGPFCNIHFIIHCQHRRNCLESSFNHERMIFMHNTTTSICSSFTDIRIKNGIWSSSISMISPTHSRPHAPYEMNFKWVTVERHFWLNNKAWNRFNSSGTHHWERERASKLITRWCRARKCLRRNYARLWEHTQKQLIIFIIDFVNLI